MAYLSDVGEQMRFFMYLLERYAEHKRMGTGEVLRSWDEAGVTDRIFDGYFRYHQECLEHVYVDIDRLVETGEHCQW